MKKIRDWFNRKFKRGPYVWDGFFSDPFKSNVPDGFDPKAPQTEGLVEYHEIKIKRLFPE